MPLRDGIQAKLESAFSGAEVLVFEDHPEHFEVRIISDQFEGLSAVARHRLVYAALGKAVGNEIHALSLKTMTKQEAK